MALKTIKGKGSLLRFCVMNDLSIDAAGHYKRPPTAAAWHELPETTTSEPSISTAEGAADETPVMYGSPSGAAAGEQWGDSEPGQNTWTMSHSGNVLASEGGRAAMQALREAQANRNTIWIERRITSDTEFEGGAAYVTSGSLPAPSDGTVTYSFSVRGRGKYWYDTARATTGA